MSYTPLADQRIVAVLGDVKHTHITAVRALVEEATAPLLQQIADLEGERRSLLATVRAATNLLDACAENLKSKPFPQKYGVPYGEVNALRAAIDSAMKESTTKT